jgi:hypothetical protein
VVVRRRGGEVSLTCLPPFTPKEDSWYLFLLEAEATPQLEGLGQLKNPITSSGIKPVTFRLVGTRKAHEIAQSE